MRGVIFFYNTISHKFRSAVKQKASSSGNTFLTEGCCLQLVSKEKVDWTFRVPGLLVLLAAKRTDNNDNKKNKRQQTKRQALLTWLVYYALICKCKFTAILCVYYPPRLRHSPLQAKGRTVGCCDWAVVFAYCISAVPFTKGDETVCCRAGDDYLCVYRFYPVKTFNTPQLLQVSPKNTPQETHKSATNKKSAKLL